MKKIVSRVLLTSCLVAITAPASAATEADIRSWLNKTVPPILMIDPAQPNLMQNKQQFFTPEGFNGFSKTLERQNVLQTPRQVAALCVTQARVAEGGTWIVDTQIVYKNPQTQMQIVEAPTDKSAPPKAKPSPYSYEQAQFYIKDVATAAEVKVNQYIPDNAPKEGFAECRAPGEVQERTSSIDEQLAFYESTLATLNERIANLRAQKAAMLSGAPMPAQAVVPPAPQPMAPAPIAMPGAPAPQLAPQQTKPAIPGQPVPLQPAAPSAAPPTGTIDINAAQNVLRAPSGVMPVTPNATTTTTVTTTTAPTSNYARPYQGSIQETR